MCESRALVGTLACRTTTDYSLPQYPTLGTYEFSILGRETTKLFSMIGRRLALVEFQILLRFGNPFP